MSYYNIGVLYYGISVEQIHNNIIIIVLGVYKYEWGTNLNTNTILYIILILRFGFIAAYVHIIIVL